MRMPSAWGFYWLAWLIAFLVPELYFVTSGETLNTLSGTVWTLEDLQLHRPFVFSAWTDPHWAIALTVWLLFAWLSLHLPFGLVR